jgi:glycerophosphoryl diester phosphodiesterase
MRFILCIAIFLTSCTKQDFQIDNLNGNRISAIGHGGMGIAHAYPMNSFESVASSLYMDSDGVEIDIDLTIDSVFVAYHDLDLSARTSVSRPVYMNYWSQISNAVYLDPIYSGYKLVSLDMILEGLPEKRNKIIFLDCKIYNPDTTWQYRNTYCNALIDIIDKYNIAGNVIIELHNMQYIELLQSKRPDLRIFIKSSFPQALAIALDFGLPGMTISMDHITSNEIREAHAHGKMVALYNARTFGRNTDAVKMSPDYIQSDRLSHLLSLLK